jgi:hypothetical protein
MDYLFFFSQCHKQLVSIDIIKNLDFLNSLLELFQSLLLARLVLIEPASVSLHISDLLFKLVNNLLSCGKTLLSVLELLLENSFSLLALGHLLPKVSVIRLLLSQHIDFVLIFLHHAHFFGSPEESLLAHEHTHPS